MKSVDLNSAESGFNGFVQFIDSTEFLVEMVALSETAQRRKIS